MNKGERQFPTPDQRTTVYVDPKAYVSSIMEPLDPKDVADLSNVRTHGYSVNRIASFELKWLLQEPGTVHVTDFSSTSNRIAQRLAELAELYSEDNPIAERKLLRVASNCAEAAFEIALNSDPEKVIFAANFLTYVASGAETGGPRQCPWVQEKLDLVEEALSFVSDNRTKYGIENLDFFDDVVAIWEQK